MPSPQNSSVGVQLELKQLSRNHIRRVVSALRPFYQDIRILRFLSWTTLLLFLATAFRSGWQHTTSDFPNYYTAAVLLAKRAPLRNYYDWTWFQRQMNYAGVEGQLGAYTSQTPLTMLPMVAFSRLPVQRAKQAWLLWNLAFLAATVWMIARITAFRIEQVWLLAFCGYFALYSNFVLGQYYVFLLFLITLAAYLLERGYAAGSGFAAGASFALKLYGGPFLLYFLVTRKWKALAGMLAAIVVAGAVAIALFGRPDLHYYLAQILPRSLEGGSIDPYNPGNPALTTILRRWFLREPQLNPHPLANAPWLFFFLRMFVTLAIAASVAIGIGYAPANHRRDFAWFLIAVLLLSTSVASYTFILVLLPVALLLSDSKPIHGPVLVGSYVLLAAPLRPIWLFPKVWLLIALFIVLGWQRWRIVPLKLITSAAAVVIVFALLDATRHMRAYAREPAQRFPQLTADTDSLFSSFPTIAPAGLFYQSLGANRYVIRWMHDARVEELSADGEAFRPATQPDGTILIELVTHGTSRTMRFDPATRETTLLPAAVLMNDRSSSPSPDGKWLAFTSGDAGQQHLWLRNVVTGRETLLAGGACNSSWPAWQLDSQALLFASDCGRGFGLPAVYRAPASQF